MLNVVGGLAATPASAYRRTRRRLAGTYRELARAHEESNAGPEVDGHPAQVEDSCEHVMRIIRLRRDGITLTADVPA